MTSDNFASGQPLESDLRWGLDLHNMEFTVRSEDEGFVPLLRVVPEQKRIPLHFEVPSEDGWKPMSIALRPDYYNGSLRIVPLNGRAKSRRFVVKWSKQTGASVDFLW